MKKVLIPTKLDGVAKKILEEHGNYEVIQEEGADLLALAANHPETYALIVRSEKVSAEVIDAFPALKLVIRAGAGFNTIDTKYARSKGIDVMNTPGANSNAVAEEVVALMLSDARHIIAADASCRSGLWEKAKFMGSEITGKTIGIVGLGYIGRLTVKRLSGFDMKVVGFDPIISEDYAHDLGVTLLSMEELFAQADYISLHIPENDATRGIVNAALFSKMKEGAAIINCARSGIINEDDLRVAKQSKNIRFLNDVYVKDAAGDKSVADIADIMLPHLGASTVEANSNAAQFAARQMIDFDDKGITSAIVNRDIPAGLDQAYADLAYTLTKLCRCVLGCEAHLKMVETSIYGSLAPYAEWLLVPVTTALHADFDQSKDHNAAQEFLEGNGVDYMNREIDSSKGFENSITIDLTGSVGGQSLRRASVRGTLTEGRLMIARINGFDNLYIEPKGHLVAFVYKDRPGVLGQIANALAEHDINIDDVRNPHDESGEKSIAVIKVNKAVSDEVINAVAKSIDSEIAFYCQQA